MADERESRRRRALRAAQAVTLGVGMALAGAACSESHTPDSGTPEDAGDAMADTAADSTTDSAIDCSGDEWWMSEECCELSGGFWDPSGGCAVPGPFVPPAMPA